MIRNLALYIASEQGKMSLQRREKTNEKVFRLLGVTNCDNRKVVVRINYDFDMINYQMILKIQAMKGFVFCSLIS